MNCPKCGCSIKSEDKESPKMGLADLGMDFDEGSIKSSLLDELLGELDDSTASKFASKKPKAISVEVIAAKPKDDDEDEEF